MKQLFIVSVFLIGSLAAAAQTTIEDDIRQFMKLSGAANVGVEMMSNMTAQFKQMLPDVPAEFWTEVMQEFKPETVVELVLPIYKKHFTQAEIKQLIAFYESPIGKKVAATLPAISQESMEIGQQWGQEIGMKVAQKLQEKGYIKN